MRLCLKPDSVAQIKDAMKSNKKNGGQALPLGLAGVVFATLLSLMLFNTGQVTAEKMRLTHAADAAVYSAMVWEARTLNYEAYLNRAMVANQVSIAQVVSIVSWMEYGTMVADEAAVLMAFVPGLQGVAANIAEFSQVMKKTSRIFAGPGVVKTLDGIITALGSAQQPVKIAGGVAALAALTAVIHKNDPDYRPSLLSAAWINDNKNSYMDFTKQYADADAQRRQAPVINDSRDAFTAGRRWELGPWWYPVGGVPMKLLVAKEGETRLMESTAPEEDAENLGSARRDPEWQWKAKDTLAVHGKYFVCRKMRCGWRWAEFPIAWGAANYSTTGEDLEYCETFNGEWFFATQCPAWSRNATTEKLADGMIQQINALYRGLQPYHDLSDISAANTDPRLTLSLELVVERGDVRTAAQVEHLGSKMNKPVTASGLGEGMFYLDDRLGTEGASEVLSAVSSAEVYFRRPTDRKAEYGARDTKLDEFGSLFNPYWDVRLRKDENARSAAWLARVASPAGGVVP